MKFKIFFSKLLSNPILILPPLFLLLFNIILSNLSLEINKNISSNILLAIWNYSFFLIILYLISAVSVGMVGLSISAIRHTAKLKDFISSVKKYSLKNLIISLIIVFVYLLVKGISFTISLIFGKAISLGLDSATVLFYLIYFILTITVFMPVSLAPICLVVKDEKILKSFKKSVEIVKKNYLFVLSLFLSLFVVNKILEYIGNPLTIEVITAILIVPLYFLILTNLVSKNDI